MSLPIFDEEHKLKDDDQRYGLVAFLLIVVLSSLIGDSIILLASVRYDAIKLNKFIVAIMQHIAVCDLLQSVFLVLPSAASILAGEWIFKDIILGQYSLIHIINSLSVKSSNVLICLLTVGKLTLLKYPLRTRHWNKKMAHLACGLVWFFAFIAVGIFTFGMPYRYGFLYVFYIITAQMTEDVTGKFENATVIIFNVLPPIAVLLSTGVILHHLFKARRVSYRSGGSMRWQGMVTVSATAVVFLVSTLPHVVTYFIFLADPERRKKLMTESYGMYLFLNRVSYFLGYLNIMSNFYIYSLTVPSFRTFLKGKAILIARKVRNFVYGLGSTSRSAQDGSGNHKIHDTTAGTVQTTHL